MDRGQTGYLPTSKHMPVSARSGPLVLSGEGQARVNAFLARYSAQALGGILHGAGEAGEAEIRRARSTVCNRKSTGCRGRSIPPFPRSKNCLDNSKPFQQTSKATSWT